jgi:hypothetical protein
MYSQNEMSILDNALSSNEDLEYVDYTFKTNTLIAAQTTEITKKKSLDFRIYHRFGDMANPGSYHDLFGLGSIADINMLFNYGLTDKLAIGGGWAKGSQGYAKELLNFEAKYKLLRQRVDNKIPVSVTLFGQATHTLAEASSDPTSVYNMTFVDRFTYTFQGIIARKMGPLSIELLPTYIWRNKVNYWDQNGLFAMGLGVKYSLSKRFALVAEAFYPFSNIRTGSSLLKNFDGKIYQIPIHVGAEIETGGHVFHINLTNSKGLLLSDFIPNNGSNWLDGQFRLGFTISRSFFF